MDYTTALPLSECPLEYPHQICIISYFLKLRDLGLLNTEDFCWIYKERGDTKVNDEEFIAKTEVLPPDYPSFCAKSELIRPNMA